MKEYFYRITHECKKGELVFWWIVRASMILAMIDSLFGCGIMRDEPDVQQVLQTFANFVGMFTWEICMMFKKNTWPRQIPSYIQNAMVTILWLGSYGGAYINLYYKWNWYDYVMHIVLGGLSALAGYEIAVAMQKRDKIKTSVSVALLCAFGFSFVVGTGWELFEFTFDQIAGGDSQHWSQGLAQQAADMYNNPALAEPYLFAPESYAPRVDGHYYSSAVQIFNDRYAVIDTMEDIVFNTLGAAVSYIGLNIYPYWHRGKRNINNLY